MQQKANTTFQSNTFQSNISPKGLSSTKSRATSYIAEPSPQQLQLIQAFLFRIKHDQSYEIIPHSIKLLRAAPFFPDQHPDGKYKPDYFGFRCWNNVTMSSLIFMKVQKKHKIYADRLYFQIGRSKYRNLAQIVDIFPDFCIPEMLQSPKPFEVQQEQQSSQLQHQREQSQLDSKIAFPSSWTDQESKYFWIATQDFLTNSQIDTQQTFENIIIDKTTDLDFEEVGFQQSEFIFWAKQLSGSLAQMQVLGKPHGNVQPRAFGVKCNKILKLRNLFDEECCSQQGLRTCKLSLIYGNAYWLDFQEQKQELSPSINKIRDKKPYKKEKREWGFKDDALALGRILLSMMLIGVIQPQDYQKKLIGNLELYRNDYLKPKSTLKTTQALINSTETKLNQSYRTAINHKNSYSQMLVTIVFKLLEPDQSKRLDAVGAFSYFQNFQDLEDFSFEQELNQEIASANERCQNVGKLIGNNIKLEISLNRSNKLRNYFQTPPNQENQNMNDSSLIEDWYDPQEFLDSYQHKALMKEKERTFNEVQKMKEKVVEVVKKFEKLNSEFQAARDIEESKQGFKAIYIKPAKPKKKKQDLQEIRKQTYSGFFKQGKRQGFGVLQNQDFTYIGQFIDDKIHGVGEKIFKSQTYQGDEYIGEFKHGFRYGFGHYTSKNGDQIHGIWQNDYGTSFTHFEKYINSKITQSRKLIWRYQGKRLRNQFHGFGILQKFQNEIQTNIGTFTKDKLNGYGRHQTGTDDKNYYEGYLKNNQYNGFGCQVTGDNFVIGSFQNGIQTGWCTQKLQNGNYYIGQIAQSKYNGFGIFLDGDKLQYNGQFLNDQRVGKGRMIITNECEYVGGFRDDKIHGYGVKIMYDKWSYEGYFDKGKRWGLGTEVLDNGDLHKDQDSFDEFEEEKKKIDSLQKKVKKFDNDAFDIEEPIEELKQEQGNQFEESDLFHQKLMQIKNSKVTPLKLQRKLTQSMRLKFKRQRTKPQKLREYIMFSSAEDDKQYYSSGGKSVSEKEFFSPKSQSLKILSSERQQVNPQNFTLPAIPPKYQTYTGAFLEDRRHGFGRCAYPDGSFFIGKYTLNNREGEDCIYITSKFQYRGGFKSNQLDGYGVQKFILQGQEYQGQFKDGARNGRGTYKYKEFEYVGEWKGGRRHGMGTLKSYDGSYEYNGSWKKDVPNGEGKQKFPNGDEYEGFQQQGKRCGKGSYKFVEDGRNLFYRGQWRDNLFNGVGEKTLQNGKYYGEWENGKGNGIGKLEFENGDVYEGMFKNNKREGMGIYSYNKRKLIAYGSWEKGEAVASQIDWVNEGNQTKGLENFRKMINELKRHKIRD